MTDIANDDGRSDKGGGRDRALDYGNAPGKQDVGDDVRAPDDIEDRVETADEAMRRRLAETTDGVDPA